MFCLVALDGLSYPEAGEQLGVTANHAGVLLHRAKARPAGATPGVRPDPPAGGLR